MAKKFYAVLYFETGEREVIERRMDQIDDYLTDSRAFILGEGDTYDDAITSAAKANPPADSHAGSGLPMPK